MKTGILSIKVGTISGQEGLLCARSARNGKKTLKEIVRQSDVFYTQVWNNLTTNHKKTLAAVVSENGKNLLSKAVTMQTKMSSSTIQRSLESLNNQDILREVEISGTKIYRFEDPFFAHWISSFIFTL